MSLMKPFPSIWCGLHLHQVWRTTGSSVSSLLRGLADSITLRHCRVSLSLHRRADPCPVSDSGSDLRHVIKLAICRTLRPSASLFGRQMGLLAPANKSRSITTCWQRSAPFDSCCDLTAWFTYYTSGFSTMWSVWDRSSSPSHEEFIKIQLPSTVVVIWRPGSRITPAVLAPSWCVVGLRSILVAESWGIYKNSAPFDSRRDLTAWFTYYASGFSTVLMCGRSEIDPCCRIMRNLLKFSSLWQLAWSNGLVHVLHQRF